MSFELSFELRETKVSCGQLRITWGVTEHCNPIPIYSCVSRHIFIQGPPMFQMWILSTHHPHSLQLPSFWVSPGSLLWANCTFCPPNLYWRHISVVHCKGDLPHPLCALKECLNHHISAWDTAISYLSDFICFSGIILQLQSKSYVYMLF